MKKATSFHRVLCRTILPLILLAGGLSISAQQRPASTIPGQYIVVLKQGHNPADVARNHGLDALHTYSHALNGFVVRVPDAAVDGLENDPRVDFVEADQVVTISSQAIPTGVSRIGTLRSTVARIDGVDQRVDADIAILDTGIDFTHPDLNVVHAVSFTADSTDGNDGNGHGTHVAGIAAALDNDFGVVGVAPGARLWAVKVLDNTGYGAWSTIIKGLDYVYQHAAEIDVVNMSFEGTGPSDALRLAIQNCVGAGVVCVAAAGNDQQDVFGADGIFNTADDLLPAAYPEVLTVSAMQDTDGLPGGVGAAASVGNDDLFSAWYSNNSKSTAPGNPVVSPGRGIDLCAPGWWILSTYPGGRYEWMSGTSMAAPHVAGAVALFTAQHGRATNAQGVVAIRQQLIFAAEPQSAWGPADTQDYDGHHEPLVSTLFDTLQPLPPVVSILSPSAGITTSTSTANSLNCAALDKQDGNISDRAVWYSSINGYLGSGSNLLAKLSAGTHVLTATVTDAAGNSSTDSITFTVAAIPTLSCAVATDKASYVTKNVVKIRATVTDGVNKVAGAAVAFTIKTAAGRTINGTATTDATGAAIFQYTVSAKRDGVGTYSVTAAASLAGYQSGSGATTFLVTK